MPSLVAIKFTKDPGGTTAWSKGDEVLVRADVAKRMTSRGFAKEVDGGAAPAAEPAPAAPVAQSTADFQPKPAKQPEPTPATTTNLDEMTREDLLDEAEKRNLDLGTGYVSKDKALAALKGEEVSLSSVQDSIGWWTGPQRNDDFGMAMRVTAPTALVVSIPEMKAHLRVDADNELAMMQQVIRDATATVERATGKSLVTQTWKLTFDWRFPSQIKLRYPPVQSVTSVAYVDEDGASQTLDASQYLVSLNSEWSPRIMPAYDVTWPSTRAVTEAVTVTYVAGQAATVVPYDLKRAVTLLAAHWFEHREAAMEGREIVPMDLGLDSILGWHRVPKVG